MISIFSGVVSSSRAGSSSPPESLTYVDIPQPPTFTDTHTLIQASTGNSIQIGDTNGKTDLLIDSDYPFFQLNGLTANYRIKSSDSTDPSTWAEIGGTGNAAALDCAVSTPGVEYYNLIVKDSNNTIKMTPTVGTTSLKSQLYQNIIVQDALFGGFLINQSVSGSNYGDLTIRFCRGSGPGGEFLYLGNTGNETTTYLGVTTIEHCYSVNTGREGVQCNGHADLRITNVTCINGGLETSAGIGQNNCFQLQNVFTGYMKRCIFYNFRALAMIATNDFLFEDCFFGWTEADRESYIQDMSANGYTKNQNVGGTITFRRCTFYNPNYTLEWVFRLQEENCNFVLEDCIFPTSAVDIVKDERSSTPYSLTITGSTFTDTPDLPTFGNPPESAYIGHEQVVTDEYWHGIGAGYRTPFTE